jgi:transposase
MTGETTCWFAGVDWGSERHQACLLDVAGKVVGERAFAHGGAGLAALCDWIVSVAGDPGLVAVAIEVPHGPVVDTLLERGFAVHAINPKQLDRLRDRFSVAGAKDDRRDARVAASGLRTDPHLFRPVQVGDPAVVELREWSRLAEELQQERVRLANRVRQQLWRYYPQLLALADDVTAEWILELWTLAPTPAKAARLREATLARLLRQHRIRRLDAASALDLLRQPAITVAAGVTEAAVLHLRSLVVRLRVANAEFRQAECKLEELCTGLSHDAAAEENGPCDAEILRSLPGVGTVTLATLLTEAGDPLAPGPRRTANPLRCGAGDQAKRQDLHRRHALRRPGAAASGRVPLGLCGHSARSQEPQPLRHPTGTWSLLWPRTAWCRRPVARAGLRPAAAAGGVQP